MRVIFVLFAILGQNSRERASKVPVRRPRALRRGEVETCVVTLQDLTELEEAGRLRADFLAMASHELCAPLTSIKGSVATLRDLWPCLARISHQVAGEN